MIKAKKLRQIIGSIIRGLTTQALPSVVILDTEFQ